MLVNWGLLPLAFSLLLVPFAYVTGHPTQVNGQIWLVSSVLSGVAACFLLVRVVTVPRRPRLIFDADREAVYTWRNGQAFVSRWIDAQPASRPWGLTYQLRGADEEAIFVPVILNAGRPRTRTPDRRTFQDNISRFMAKGAMPTAETIFHWKDPAAFRVDPIPPDGLAQVDAILTATRRRQLPR